MGRTSSITPAQAKKLEAALLEHQGNVAAMARATGIPDHKVRRWVKAKTKPSPEQLLQDGIDKVEEGLRLIRRGLKATAGDQ